MLQAGKLRHRIVIQALDVSPNSNGDVQGSMGEPLEEWVTLGQAWAAIEPVSGREFIAAQSEQSKISTRITVRYRTDIDFSTRVYHEAKGQYYNVEAVLADKDSGLEYLTLLCSTGVRYQADLPPAPPTHSFLFKDNGSDFLYKDDGISQLWK
jgi:SPP1 family predicted phage head-tail adaptor